MLLFLFPSSSFWFLSSISITLLTTELEARVLLPNLSLPRMTGKFCFNYYSPGFQRSSFHHHHPASKPFMSVLAISLLIFINIFEVTGNLFCWYFSWLVGQIVIFAALLGKDNLSLPYPSPSRYSFHL